MGSAWEPFSLSDSPEDQGQADGSADSPGSHGSGRALGWASAWGRRRSGVPWPVCGSSGESRDPRVAGMVGGRTVDTAGGHDWRWDGGRTHWEAAPGAANSFTRCTFSISALICIDARHWPQRAPEPAAECVTRKNAMQIIRYVPRSPGLACVNPGAARNLSLRARRRPRTAPPRRPLGSPVRWRAARTTPALGHLSQRLGLRL